MSLSNTSERSRVRPVSNKIRWVSAVSPLNRLRGSSDPPHWRLYDMSSLVSPVRPWKSPVRSPLRTLCWRSSVPVMPARWAVVTSAQAVTPETAATMASRTTGVRSQTGGDGAGMPLMDMTSELPSEYQSVSALRRKLPSPMLQPVLARLGIVANDSVDSPDGVSVNPRCCRVSRRWRRPSRSSRRPGVVLAGAVNVMAPVAKLSGFVSVATSSPGWLLLFSRIVTAVSEPLAFIKYNWILVTVCAPEPRLPPVTKLVAVIARV